MRSSWEDRTAASLLIATLAVAATTLTACVSVDFTPPPANPPASTLGLDASATAAASASADASAPGAASTTPPAPAAGAPGSPSASAAAPGPGVAGSSPGINMDPGGIGTVRGTLLYKNVEGGTWVIVEAVPGSAAEGARALVVISNPNAFPLQSMKGKYVEAAGSMSQTGNSTTIAGLQMVATSITPK